MKKIIKIVALIGAVIAASVGSVLAFNGVQPLLDCSAKDRLTIVAVGDIMLQSQLQRRASFAGFQSLWWQAIPYIKAADLAFANIEGPMAYGVSKSGELIKDPGHRLDGQVYTSYPRFNYHPKLASALKRSGFDVIATANNHALDRNGVGVDRTLKVLENAKLKYTGTLAQGSKAPWYTITEAKGFKVAWLACTSSTNGIEDKEQQVLYCFKPEHRRKIVSIIKQLRVQVDAIIVAPHWGKRYEERVTPLQVSFAKQLLESGATAVIGTHPHVIQPIKRYRTRDHRDTIIAYSLGNFVSYQQAPRSRSTVILYLTLTRKQGKTTITDVAYVPAYMNSHSDIKKMSLQILQDTDKNTVGYYLLSQQLGKQFMLLNQAAFSQHFCPTPVSVQANTSDITRVKT
jgi:Bacterial capsule synthesis protein PGA_cap